MAEAGAVMVEAETMAGIMTTIIERKLQHHSTDMKKILLLSTVIALLATSGCSMFSPKRNAANDRNHPENGGNVDHSSGVNHGEYTGDSD
jgi:hypothetical protein